MSRGARLGIRSEIAEHLRALAELGVTDLNVGGRPGEAASHGHPRGAIAPSPPARTPDRTNTSERVQGGRGGHRDGRSGAPGEGSAPLRSALPDEGSSFLEREARRTGRGVPDLPGEPGRMRAGPPPEPEVIRSSLTGDLFAEEEEVDPSIDAATRLEGLRRDEIGECTRCKLAGGRKTIVFGSGDPEAELMFVGEGPGADEDEQGLPFVGRAGQLLTKMIESMAVAGRRLTREEVYIANIIKCRPPGNRDPEPDEIAACEGFLFKQISIIKPRLIVTLGAFAARTLLRTKAPISALRGRFHEYRGTLLMPTFHPAYVLRNYTEETRRTVYEDLKKAAFELERAPRRR